MHTDYFSNAKPRIRILSDRIEFLNPGSLPKDIKYILKEEFSMPRNNTIARIFRTIKLSENIGSGFYKMFKGWISYYKRKPKVEGDFDYYKIMFYLEKKAQLQEKVTEKVTENQQQILEAIEKKPHITVSELAGILGISERKTKENIKKLKEKLLLERIGPDKGGHWFVSATLEGK